MCIKDLAGEETHAMLESSCGAVVSHFCGMLVYIYIIVGECWWVFCQCKECASRL